MESSTEGSEKRLQGWQFKVVDSKGNANTLKTETNGTIQLDPFAVGAKYVITEDPSKIASKRWQSVPPEELDDGVYTVEKGEKELYFANRLKPATLVLIKYEDRNGNSQLRR